MGSYKLLDTKLPTLQIAKEDKSLVYDYISSGSEGYVYGYNRWIAMKFFLDFESDLNRKLKLEKVEVLAQLKDANFTFPIGFVGYESGFKEGYYMDRVIPYDEENPTVLYAKNNFSTSEVRDILIGGDRALQRVHSEGYFHGDIRDRNVLLDANKTFVFIDTDNGFYKGFDCDYPSHIANSFYTTYWHVLSPSDNDKFMFALLALNTILKGVKFYSHKSAEFYESIIGQLNVSRAVKRELLYIFSPKKDKPYIGPILESIDTEEPLIAIKK